MPAVATAMNGNSSTPSISANPQVLSSNGQAARLDSLKQEIDFGKTRASNMEAELNELQSEHDQLKAKMSDLEATIHQDESDDQNGIQINVDAYNHAVDDYNAQVPQWNQLLADYNHKSAAYSAEIKQINERVAEYNALIGAQP
jgi:chromosome segregation ATPase